MPLPGALEQEQYELTNRMRLNPQRELGLLLDTLSPAHSADPDVDAAVDFFGVDGTLLASQWAALVAVQPLAWSIELHQAAAGHNALMQSFDDQQHQLPGEPSLSQRFAAAGWATGNGGWSIGENIYAYSFSMFYAHAGFAIDWGFGPGGMQNPAGHRNSIMSPQFREVGIAVLAENNPNTEVGPYLVTQDFGFRSVNSAPYLLGVAFNDLDGDGWYDAGEGRAGLTVTTTGAGPTATWGSGGYQLQLAGGAFGTVVFSGGDLGASIAAVVAAGTANLKLDLVGTTLRSSGTITLDAGAGALDLLGETAIDGFGNAAANDIRGSWGDNRIDGAAGADRLWGGVGSDRLYGGSEADFADGGTGNDTLYGDAGADWLEAGDGTDRMFGGLDSDFVAGGAGDDTLYGDGAADGMSGGAGNDLAYGGGDVDWVYAGDGADLAYGDDGADVLLLEAGDDQAWGGTGGDYVNGGQGADTIDGGADDDWLEGDVVGTPGDDRIFGGDGADFANGGGGVDRLYGGLGGDALFGDAGDDTLDGGDGVDWLYAGAGTDTLFGGAGNDIVVSEDGADSAEGGAGADYIDGGGGADTLWGGADADWMLAGAADDRAWGGDGADAVGGDLGNDTLWGDLGDDALWGGDGDDRLAGGAGTDWLDGGPGADRFVLAPGGGFDNVLDWNDGADRIDLVAFGFAGSAAFFTAGGTLTGVGAGGGTALLTLPDGTTASIAMDPGEQLDVADLLFVPVP